MGEHPLPASTDALVELVTTELTEARTRPDIAVTAPGKFVGELN